MSIKDLKAEKKDFLKDWNIKYKKLERELINANIASRDAYRAEKQLIEDRGGTPIPELDEEEETPKVVIEEELGKIDELLEEEGDPESQPPTI